MKKAYVALLALTIAILPAAANAACPSPAPNCTSSGTLSLLKGSYGCLAVRADTSNVVQVSILLLTVTAAGIATGTMAKNENLSGGNSTYQDFQSNSLTYCVNADNTTGYIFPSGSGSCPVPFVLSGVSSSGLATRLRAVDSTEQRAQTTVCRHQ